MKDIIIVGGGTAAWTTAYQLSKSNSVKSIRIIYSGEIPIIGTGEGATGSLNDVILKGDDKEFLEKTNSTVKLGILFENWQGEGTSFRKFVDGWYYDGIKGGAGKDIDIMHKIIEEDANIEDYSVNAFLMKHGIHDYTEVKRHTYHFDGKNVGQFFRDRCLATGKISEAIDTIIEVANQNEQVLYLQGNQDTYSADYYIDCTGFARLFDKTFKHEFESYSEWLDIDGAVPFLLPTKKQNYTVSRAMKNGWMWEVPKTDNCGSGYNFSSQHTTADEVVAEAEKLLGHKVKPIKEVRYTPGCYKKVAKNNYAYIGLSASFIEPLEATALHSSIYSADYLIKVLEGTQTIDDYNDYVYEMVQDFRDFTIMHYRYATRSDTKFWQDQKKKPIPKKLQEQMRIFESGSLECLYKTTHIYFMFQTALGFKFIKKPKVFNYNKDIEVPTFNAIERIKKKHNVG
jgi:flavin-dependent dehydrogenase